MDDYKEFIHFGLTSQDINNTSIPLSVKDALEQVYYPQIEELIAQLRSYAEEWAGIPMLAKTHGQPASPTRLGKEIMVFVYRLERQLATLKACPLTAKFGGATGFGLGLNYVYQVIEAHEGKIYVNSIEGDFTEFTLFIPKIMEEL